MQTPQTPRYHAVITLDDVIKSRTFYTGFETYLTKAHCQVTPPPPVPSAGSRSVAVKHRLALSCVLHC